MITGGKITSVEAKRDKDDPITGLSINIGLDDLKVNGEDVEISYTYTVSYAQAVGTLKITGVLYAKETTKKAAEISKSWKDSRRLPNDFAEIVLNTINFTCGTNGTLVVRPINLSPPMIPPKIEIAKGGGKGAS
ncbi:hypothetical protein HY992_02150 [Candidatus Micrarchaeota archaeon]|nr:hypothetical protein [Candidatus Micrarchaeota archaeon]